MSEGACLLGRRRRKGAETKGEKRHAGLFRREAAIPRRRCRSSPDGLSTMWRPAVAENRLRTARRRPVRCRRARRGRHRRGVGGWGAARGGGGGGGAAGGAGTP